MFQAVKRWVERGHHERSERSSVPRQTDQLSFGFDAAPRNADELLATLRARGLRRITRCSLTNNSRVMVSFRDGEMRIHHGYLAASPEVHDAIVRLVEGRTKTIRREAGKFIVAHSPARAERVIRRERTHPDDEAWSARLVSEHSRLNTEHFGGSLGAITVRVSRRMKSRLGHYSPATGDAAAEIAISRRHIRRHGWDDALETLLHEMVHQWQAETGAPLDHGPGFRKKAREVGIPPRAKRQVGREQQIADS